MSNKLKLDVRRTDNNTWVCEFIFNDTQQFFTGETPSEATMKAVEFIEQYGTVDSAELVIR